MAENGPPLDVFDRLSDYASAELQSLAREVLATRPLKAQRFHFSATHLHANDEAWRELYASVKRFSPKGTPALYYFMIPDTVNLDNCRSAFATWRGSKVRKAARDLKRSSTCLYVGSSKDLCKRLSEHLGFGHHETYSLQMVHWAGPLHLEIALDCATYPTNTPKDVLEALEGRLWNQLLPMFGRKGGR